MSVVGADRRDRILVNPGTALVCAYRFTRDRTLLDEAMRGVRAAIDGAVDGGTADLDAQAAPHDAAIGALPEDLRHALGKSDTVLGGRHVKWSVADIIGPGVDEP